MKNVIKIIQAHGGFDALKKKSIRIDPPHSGLMRLCIEYIGKGPRGQAAISIAHYFEQNGDSCQDPDVVMEVPDGEGWDDSSTWGPVYFQQAIPPIFQEACVNKDGQVYIRPAYIKDINSFARMWDKNLGDQGFVLAALQKLGKSRGVEVSQLSNGRYSARSLNGGTINVKFDDLVAVLLPLPVVGRDE